MSIQYCILNSEDKFSGVVEKEQSSNYRTVLATVPTLKPNFEATWQDGTWIVKRIRNTENKVEVFKENNDEIKNEQTAFNDMAIKYLQNELNTLHIKMSRQYESDNQISKKYTDYENVLKVYIETCSNIILKEDDLYVDYENEIHLDVEGMKENNVTNEEIEKMYDELKKESDAQDKQKVLNYKNYFKNLEDLTDF